MTIAVAQISARATYPGSGGSGTTATCTLSGVTAGNVLTASNVAAGAPFATVPTISVSDGTSYTQGAQKGTADGSQNNPIACIHFLPNVTGGSKSIVSTNTAGAFNCYGWARAVEFSGLATTSPLDITNITAGGTSQTTASVGPSGTLAQAAEVVISVVSVESSGNITLSEPASFTNVDSNLTDGTFGNFGMGSIDYQITSATTSVTANYGALGITALATALCMCSLMGASGGGGTPLLMGQILT